MSQNSYNHNHHLCHLTHAPALLGVGPEAAVALSAGVAHLPHVAVIAAGLVALVAHTEAGAGVGAPLGPRDGRVPGVARAAPEEYQCWSFIKSQVINLVKISIVRMFDLSVPVCLADCCLLLLNSSKLR